jgi:hypothetical protein
MQSDLLLENPPAASKSKEKTTKSVVRDEPPTHSPVMEAKSPALKVASVPDKAVPETAAHALALPGPKKPPEDEIEDFDWSDKESVLFPTQPAVAVYFNPRGEIVIRQESQYHPDEDHFIYLQRKNLRPLIERLQQIDRG